MRNTLWYRRPAESFLEALPLGNGWLGAMARGGTAAERIDLNADTLWSGGPGDRNDHGASAYLGKLRDAVLRDRDHLRADAIARRMQGPYTESYQPLGTLHLVLAHGAEATGYRRALDLDRAVHSVDYTVDGVRFSRESFVSAVDNVLVVGLSCDRPGGLSFTAGLASPHPTTAEPTTAQPMVLLSGRAPTHVAPDYHDEKSPIVYDTDTPTDPRVAAGMAFSVGLRIATAGRVSHDATTGAVRVDGADSAVVLVTADTGFRGRDRRPLGVTGPLAARVAAMLTAAAARPLTALRAAHIADHAALFERATLTLTDPDIDGRDAPESRPTDERLAAVRAGEVDPGLTALHFAYGRYLLIASSRPGSQPANLQGIWNTHRRPPWSANWTTNINVQMNYWPAEVTGLPECHQPLLDLVGDLVAPGAVTARAYYDCAGWTAHHNVDIWAATNPVSGSPQWANWPLGAAWLCAHLWEHFLFSGDSRFLADRAYPVLREAALFLLDFLVEDADGRLVTCPSTSPEHQFRVGDAGLASVTASATLDFWLIDELFDACLRAGAALGVDTGLADRILAARARLRPPPIGADGRLLEWWEDLPEEDPGHRHLSMLYGLYPGRQIDARRQPALFAAARRALDRRLAHGGGGTGWSLAWVAALAARLGDGELAHRSLVELLAGSTAPNLFDLHPPRHFQIDGNFGATAAIAEMLMRSHTGTVQLLPALPRAWPAGSVRGLRARGGVRVDIDWRDGALTAARLTADRAGPVRVTPPPGTRAPLRVESTAGDVVPTAGDVVPTAGDVVPTAGEPGTVTGSEPEAPSVTFHARAGTTYLVRPEPPAAAR